MKSLRERVLSDGKVLNDNVLQVGSFLNHMVDINLLHEIGKEFAKVFKDLKPTKIITIEASGIPMAALCALELGIPFIVAKKQSSSILKENIFKAEVFSYTKQKAFSIYVSRDVIKGDDRLLIIDDFLASGEAVSGLIKIINEANATLAGVGICIEKTYQNGAKDLYSKNINLHSLVRIKSLAGGVISLYDDESKKY
ncbi:MAG: xanthine phosphoribosyltransferase [Lachnospiraceae bacterium]|nr:xanthine phosphoribosyltransferase [Lachnospiraceae bacterium]